MKTKGYKTTFSKPFIAGKELYYIAQAVIENNHTSGNGPFTQKCHQWLTRHLGCTKALLTNSCTAALEMAAILADVSPGDEVIMPSFSFVSTANAFVLRGATPVFIDINPHDLNMDENLIEPAITQRTKAVVPVHYAGIGCEMDSIMEICDRFNLIVIEDAAHALFSKYKGKELGTIGHIGAFSFHETKNIISGEGGALLINDSAFVKRSEIIWEKGTNRCEFFRGEVNKYSWVDIGSSYLPSDIIAAFLYAQLENIESIVRKRRELFSSYWNGLEGLSNRGLIQIPDKKALRINNGHLFYMIVQTAEDRQKLLSFLKSKGIMALSHFVPLHSSEAGQKYGKSVGSMQVTDSVSERIVRLPMFFELTFEEVDNILDAIHAYYNVRQKEL